MKDPRLAWWRDCALYFILPALVAWQTADFAPTTKAIMGAVIAGGLAFKAKLSNGKPKPANQDGQESN